MLKSLIVLLTPLLVLLAVVAIACILGYGFVQSQLVSWPLHKIISKTTLVLLLLGLWPLKRWLSMSWRDIGYTSPWQFFRQIGQGMALGVMTLLPVLLMLYALDVQVFDEQRQWSTSKLAGKIGLGLFFAVLIGFAEETLFRGLLLTSFNRYLSVTVAVSASSAYYALLHFLKSKSTVSNQEATLADGFRLMAEAFANWLNPDILSALIALWVVGLFLAMLRRHFVNGLGWCIGCHAAWVWQIKTCKELFNLNPQSSYHYLVSSYDGVIGPLVTGWLSLALLVFVFLKRRSARPV